MHGFTATGQAGLPKRLVLLLDGVSYRDVMALQAGLTYTDPHGRQRTRQAFDQGYFPASRLISTFPSASDVAWMEIFGNRPPAGYQRTYFSTATRSMISQNGVTTSMEYELQMNWQMESNFRRAFGYLHPHPTFKYEVRELLKSFLRTTNGTEQFYGLIRASDDAQHTKGDIFVLLGILDEELKKLGALYLASEGRKLEILILSDHGNNRAGPGRRVAIRSFLNEAGYRVSDGIRTSQDVVLPTVGIQNWVELHCAASETEKLALQLAELEGVDCVTARVMGHPHQFLIVNSKHERARIDWKPEENSFRYTGEQGDPLDYHSVLEKFVRQQRLDADGFASADEWMQATLTHRYPLALERIARGHTQVTLNPASILISLTNGYVHSSWIIKQLSSILRQGGTHGALDELSSTGVLLSNFAPTTDTSTRRVAAQYDGFAGLKNPRRSGNGAEWSYREVQALTAVPRSPLDYGGPKLPGAVPLLRIWTPHFASLAAETPIQLTLTPTPQRWPVRIRRSDPAPKSTAEKQITLNFPLALSEEDCFERLYQLPDILILESLCSYRISGRTLDPQGGTALFDFTFQTDSQGLPVVQ